MAKNSGTGVSIDRDSLVKVIDEIRSIDSRLSEVQGTQAQRLATARLAVLEQPAIANLESRPKAFPNVGTWADVVEFIEGPLASWLAEVEALADEAVTGWLKEHRSASDDEVDKLKEQRSALVEQAKALLTLLPTLGVDVDGLEIPKRSGGGRPVGSRSVKRSGAHFYVVIDGTRKDMAGSQDKLSSVAWYHGAKLCSDCPTTNNGRGVQANTLTTAIEKALGGSIPATPWSVELDNGNVVGMEVVEEEATDANDEAGS